MSVWTDEARGLLGTMWAMGRSSREIATALATGVSRNAVMGMVNRLGLMGLGRPTPARLQAMRRVSALFEEPFSMSAPLHREALLTLMTSRTRSAADLSTRSGVSLADCERFLARLPLVWPSCSSVPSRWSGGLEGNLAFILDMAVVSGRLARPPLRPVSTARSVPAVSTSRTKGEVLGGMAA